MPEAKPAYKKGIAGFDQMAVGIGVVAIVVAMVLVVLTQMQNTNIVRRYYDSENYTATAANTTITNAISALGLYGNFFTIIVILGIFIGVIGLLYMVTRQTGSGGA